MYTILDCLEHNTNQFPQNIICEDPHERVSFQEFTDRAKTVGYHLSQRYRPERRPIVVFMDNTAQSWTAMIGAVYSGNFYAVADAQMPMERIRNIVAKISPLAVIVDEVTRSKGEKLEDVDVISIEELTDPVPENENCLKEIRRSIIDTDPAYILFTSGSTGTPKGTVVNHASVIKYTEWYTSTFHIDEKTIFGSQTPFYFSMSVATMFSAILAGAGLVLIPKLHFSFPANLIDFMNEKRINTIYWVPSAMNIVANYKALDKKELPHLKKVLFCGEVMPTKQLNYWIAHMPKETLFANLYGPTETTDVAAYFVVDRPFRDDEPLPIGYPCANCAIMVLKADNTLAEIGEEGELCIRGSFLANGYYNDPEKTEAVFTQNPLNSSYPELIYRTGDIVKYNDRHELTYITRKDFQIKHLGYRIELAEIETAINAIEAVFECACIYDTEKNEIVLYYSGQELSAKLVIQNVRDKLPKYMIPTKYIFLTDLPHNANGKIDRKRLKEMYTESK